jgi:monoamine oxidase
LWAEDWRVFPAPTSFANWISRWLFLRGRGVPGGRVQTLREGLDPELSAEAGATRIPDTHQMTLAYVREFGLSLEPFKSGDLADV